MDKRIVVLQLIFNLCLFSSIAEAQENIKLKIEAGFLWDAVEGKIYFSGPFLNIEPKLKTSRNTFIGIRLGAALNSQKIINSDPSQFYINNDLGYNRVISFSPTFNYYFHKSKFRPFLGVGLGYNFLTSSKKGHVIGNSSDLDELSINNKVGFLLRGGLNLYGCKIGRFDLSKLIVGIDFNAIPKVDVELSKGQKLGTIVSSNAALSIGYTIGN